MNVWAIISGLAALPGLISKIEALLDNQKKIENQKWSALSALAEKHLKEAESPEQIRKVADEIARLLRTS